MENMEISPDDRGFYGQYGGSYIPELLWANVEELRECYRSVLSDEIYKAELEKLLKNYGGRPTPLYLAENLSRETGARVYLKREDLCHTGSHKLNNVLGQALLAVKMGKKHIIAETGAGQHGVATATACALMNLPCTVFMGKKDTMRQKLNVTRMEMLGATVVPVDSGSRTLKDATNEAIRHWINNPDDTYYLIGSTIGPHPYPDLVTRLQSVISRETISQLRDAGEKGEPGHVLACVGGGSNAAGAFYHFIGNGKTKLTGAEAAGEGVDSEKTAASINRGSTGVIHGSMTLLLQNGDGQVLETHSISAGLDYPGIGPVHAWLNEKGLAQYLPVTDSEAIEAAFRLTETEGIIPALESAHAVALLEKITFEPGSVIVICLSGRGDKDMETYSTYFEGRGRSDTPKQQKV